MFSAPKSFGLTILLSATLFSYLTTPARGQQPPEKLTDKQLHRPGPLPDRIILTWRQDPAKSQAVTWRSDTSVRQGLAQIAPAEAGPDFTSRARTVPATTTPLKTNLSEANYHTVHFENLTPKTLYAYRVGDGANWSEWSHFQTASTEPEPFSFLYFGDAQYDLKEHWSRLVREAYAAAPRARFFIHAGDLIQTANSDAHWGEWFQAAGWINMTVPSIPSAGNHEYATDANGRDALSRHWRAQFALPEHGPPGLEETAYFIDFQGVRIICLNSNELREQQTPWLERVLSTNPNRWTIVTLHHPLYSIIQGRTNAEVRRLWQPFFDKYRVDLVLQGHDHAYGRSGLESAGSVPGGTVYAVSVSGPKMYNANRQPWMVSFGRNKQLYQVIRVDGDRLNYEARTALGTLYDSFELRKQSGGPNQLIEGPRAAEAGAADGPVQWSVVLGVLAVTILLAFWVARRRARK